MGFNNPDITFISITSVIAVVSVVCNFLIILTILKRSKLHNATYFAFISIAVIDVVSPFLYITSHLIKVNETDFFLKGFLCRLSFSFQGFSLLVFALTFTSVVLVRCLKKKCFKIFVVTLITIWILSALIHLPKFINVEIVDFPDELECYQHGSWKLYIDLPVNIVSLIVCSVVVIASIIVMKKQRKRVSNQVIEINKNQERQEMVEPETPNKEEVDFNNIVLISDEKAEKNFETMIIIIWVVFLTVEILQNIFYFLHFFYRNLLIYRVFLAIKVIEALTKAYKLIIYNFFDPIFKIQFKQFFGIARANSQ